MSDKNAGLLFHAKWWNDGYSSTSDLECAAIDFARSVGPLGEQDIQDLRRCVGFRIDELRYALDHRHLRHLALLRLTGEEARSELDRLVSLRGRVT